MPNEHTPDILNTLANLSSDEVFTSPELVNALLDLLPQELFTNPKSTFLDPSCKTGVFLREIAKRLMKGIAKDYPDVQERINHIMGEQLYGISLTNLTYLVSNRTVYCSMYPDGDMSAVSSFGKGISKGSGNIRWESIKHTWDVEDENKAKCIYCSAPKKQYRNDENAENYAYGFIHPSYYNRVSKMKFDVIIGNPPYQLSDGGAQASSTPIYNLFIENAIKMNPKYLCMIVPARWYTGGKTPEEFRLKMITDRHIKELYDHSNSADCFPTLGDHNIKGGICYFLWSRDYDGPCTIHTMEKDVCVRTSVRYLKEDGCDVFIRDEAGVQILNKIKQQTKSHFQDIVSSRKPFGLPTNFKDFVDRPFGDKTVKIYANKAIGYVSKSQLMKNADWVSKYKLFVPKAVGNGDVSSDRIKPKLMGPNTCCTETYLVIGPFNTEEESKNCATYIETKFFHYLLSLKKITQDNAQKVYQFIPMVPLTKAWTDAELYKEFNLTDEEIAYIESTVWPAKEVAEDDE